MIPPSYKAATWRTVLPQQEDGDLAFAFTTDNGPVRLRMTEEDVVTFTFLLMESMANQRARMKFQSQSSSGSPSVDGSPQEGQSE